MAPHDLSPADTSIDPSPADTSIDDDILDEFGSRRGMLAFLVVVGACLVVVVASVVLLIVQPGKSSSNPSGQCYDSAMQMEMPCGTN